jgi:nicotinate-nucleotide adenylyltransferase
MNERRIGAYGGTFDPFHNAHLEVARAVVRSFELDQLLLIPASVPPHKQSRSISDAYHRYAMAVLASLDEPRIKVSAMEILAPDKPYTFETIERLRGVYGSRADLYFVIGADSFEELAAWREPQRILANANLIALTRPGYSVRASLLPEKLEANIIDLRDGAGGPDSRALQSDEMKTGNIFLADFVNMDVSATEIRRRARDGETIDDLVPPRVADYVKKYELYRR